MAHDGKLLARAREALEQDRAANQAEQQQRTAKVYLEIPQIEQIDNRLRGHMADLVRLTISKPPDLAEHLDALKEANLDLQMHRAELLTEHGYPIEYLDEIFTCPECHDTGFINGALCACMERRYNRELTKELSALLRNGNESFDRFDLNYYSDQPEEESGISPRRAMTIAFHACRHFAYSFPETSQNLLLRGGTGLGKTYLSACIARVVAEKGFSVCYDTAFSALEAFEKQKFSRVPEDAEAASLRVDRMLSCDLMILDDLGTEMVTPMSVSALYTLLNSRLNAGLHTVISTNCTNEELERRYTPQICSRIYGEFLELPFYGTDIRILQKRGCPGDR